jgi:succinate dehydrogenase / fumarate reductase cytochrome b subunit
MEWYSNPPIPREFIWRRIQSLTGLGLVIYIIFHLFTNSQAALLIGNDGKGFIDAVNSIQNLPYLIVIEILLLGIPIFLHSFWGIQYIFQAKYNSFPTDGSKPHLKYGRNKAYTWQRLTAWILLVGIVAHVIHMRIIEHPTHVEVGSKNYYLIKLNYDSGLETVADRLNVKIFNQQDVTRYANSLVGPTQMTPVGWMEFEQKEQLLNAMSDQNLKNDQVIVSANNFGTIELLMLRDQFKSPLMMVLYTVFVLAAVFHAFNGLWTFLITWGIILTNTSQRIALKLSKGLMFLIGFLGLATIWLTYWINLKS